MRSSRRFELMAGVTLIHVLLILGPLAYYAVYSRFFVKKEQAFRVKIGGLTPSHAPEVGPPERIRPSAPSAPPAPPQPVPQPAPPKPVPAPPKVKPQPKKTVPKPKPKTKPKPKKTAVKPKQKPQPKKQTAAKAPQTPRKAQPVPRHKRTVADLEKEVYRPAGGSNTNINVPIGTRDRGQQKGPADHRTPMGGATADQERYWKVMRLYLYDRWTQPPKSLLGGKMPSAEIELQVAEDGRVLTSRILRSSGIPAMDDTVRNLLARLDRVPAPPEGKLTFSIELAVE